MSSNFIKFQAIVKDRQGFLFNSFFHIKIHSSDSVEITLMEEHFIITYDFNHDIHQRQLPEDIPKLKPRCSPPFSSMSPSPSEITTTTAETTQSRLRLFTTTESTTTETTTTETTTSEVTHSHLNPNTEHTTQTTRKRHY
jgi:hypothetical protein